MSSTNLHNICTLTKLIVMMGVALVTKCVVGNLPRKTKNKAVP